MRMAFKRRTWLVRNAEGIPILLNVTTKKHRQTYKHEVFGCCKGCASDVSCLCDAYSTEACKCNWQECFVVTGGPQEPLKQVLATVAMQCGKLSRCTTCTSAVFDEPEFAGSCGSCFMQNIVDGTCGGKRSVGSDCPICLEGVAHSDSIKLPCDHYIHVLCAPGLARHADDDTQVHRCPFCRAPYDEEVLQDHRLPRDTLA